MGRIGGEVVDFPWIGGEVVELFRGAGRFPEGLVDAGQLAVLPGLLESTPAGLAELVEGIGGGGEIGVEIADVFPFSIGEAAAQAVEFVEAVGVEEFHLIGGWFHAFRPEERASLHLRGGVDPGEGKDGGRKIDEGDRLGRTLAGLERGEVAEFFRDADDHGDSHARLLEVAFAARKHAAMVRVVENDGVVRETGFLEFLENLPDLGVHIRHAVVVAGQVLADFR